MSTDPLNIRLNTELRCRSSAKQTIIETLWGEQFTDTTQFQNNEPRFAIYLRYYERECRLSSGGVPFDTHRQVLDAISVMSDERHKPFHVLQTALSAKFPSFDAASTGIKKMGITLCLRLWLMLNVRDRQEGNHVTSTRVVTLDDTAPVLSAPKRKPATSNLVFATEVRILDNNFHILNLERLADIELVPTNNLADHLYLDEETGRRRLFIFRCGYFLSAHLAPSRRTAHCLNIFDEEFLLETRQTYKLLFPPIRQDCTKYLRELQEDLKFDEDLGRLPIGSTPPMEPPFVPSDFKFYGKRLAMLSKTLNSSNPTSLSQLWYDRRNKQTWYTMWIAIVVFLLTLFFGFASIIIGGLQVWLAWPKSS